MYVDNKEKIKDLTPFHEKILSSLRVVVYFVNASASKAYTQLNSIKFKAHVVMYTSVQGNLHNEQVILVMYIVMDSEIKFNN
jgi:hypothetical protein